MPQQEISDINATDDLNAQNSARIDKKLLIDANHLTFGSVITEGNYSIVRQGWFGPMPVAVKTILPGMSASISPELEDKFCREVSMLSRVNHENIVKFIGVTIEPKMMIVTELMKGGSLQKFLSDLRPSNLKLCICFALEISQAMEYLHQNRIIYRDLNPFNLLLTEDKKKIKLAGFGLAREETDYDMTTEAGTYHWMAPELFSVGKHYNHKVDVYSFSMVLWELLTNCIPCTGSNIILVADATAMNRRPSIENIPSQIAPLLESCWDENPENRPEFQQVTQCLKVFSESIIQQNNVLEASPSSLEAEEEIEDPPANEQEVRHLTEEEIEEGALRYLAEMPDDVRVELFEKVKGNELKSLLNNPVGRKIYYFFKESSQNIREDETILDMLSRFSRDNECRHPRFIGSHVAIIAKVMGVSVKKAHTWTKRSLYVAEQMFLRDWRDLIYVYKENNGVVSSDDYDD